MSVIQVGVVTGDINLNLFNGVGRRVKYLRQKLLTGYGRSSRVGFSDIYDINAVSFALPLFPARLPVNVDVLGLSTIVIKARTSLMYRPAGLLQSPGA